ncbi:hypothetical protein [Asaia astilbis]
MPGRKGRYAAEEPPVASQPLVEAPPGMVASVATLPRLCQPASSCFRTGPSPSTVTQSALICLTEDSDAYLGGSRPHRLQLPDFLIVTAQPGGGDMETPIGTQFDKAHSAQSLEARLIAQVLGAPDTLAEERTMQSRATAGLKIGLIPHRSVSKRGS